MQDNADRAQVQETNPISVGSNRLPRVSHIYTFDPYSWTVTVVDTSIGNVSAVRISWGDNTMVSTGPGGGTFTHTYKNAGTYTITQTDIDTIGQQSVAAYTAPARYFSISGKVRNSSGIGVASATVMVMNGTTTKTVYTSTSGTFTAGSLKPGTYTIVVSKNGYTFPAPPSVSLGPSSPGNTIDAIDP